MNSNKDTFWITNICNRNVSLTDLNLTVKAFSSVNLLDNKHYYYTLEQLQASALNGSLFKKKSMIVIRQVEPSIIKSNITLASHAHLPSRGGSIYKVAEAKYEELNISDEDFANQNVELTEIDKNKG